MPSSDGLVSNMAENLGDPSSATGDKQTGTTQFVFFAIDKKHFFIRWHQKIPLRQKKLHQGRKCYIKVENVTKLRNMKIENAKSRQKCNQGHGRKYHQGRKYNIEVESATSRQKMQHHGRKCNITVKCSLRKV